MSMVGKQLKWVICSMLIASVMFLGACNLGTKNVDSGYYSENFDNLYYWNHSAQVTRDKAHSGLYSTYVDSSHPFSQTFEMDLGQAKYFGYTRLRVKAWCLKESMDIEGQLNATIVSGDSTFVSNAADLKIALKQAGSWGACTFSLDLPANPPADGRIKVFLNSSNGQKAYMDDVEIIFKK